MPTRDRNSRSFRSRSPRATASVHAAFSLVELVIVIVIIGIIAAIAVPRFSSATDNANRGQVQASVSVLQNAVDLFIAEHNPGALTLAGLNGTGGAGNDINILTMATDSAGDDAGTRSFGPYLRNVPANLLIGSTATAWASQAGAAPADGQATTGWVINLTNNLVGYVGTDEKSHFPSNNWAGTAFGT